MDIEKTAYTCIKESIMGYKLGKTYHIYPTDVTVGGDSVYTHVTEKGHLLSDDYLTKHFKKVKTDKDKDLFQAIRDTAFEVGKKSTSFEYERLSNCHGLTGEHKITITWRDEEKPFRTTYDNVWMD